MQRTFLREVAKRESPQYIQKLKPLKEEKIKGKKNSNIVHEIEKLSDLRKKKIITVLGGKQVRPNIHIDDMIRVYKFFLNNINLFRN